MHNFLCNEKSTISFTKKVKQFPLHFSSGLFRGVPIIDRSIATVEYLLPTTMVLPIAVAMDVACSAAARVAAIKDTGTDKRQRQRQQKTFL